ncbi:hypothetical protein GCM10020256_34060 [Streptomyces thermocoprophilus]
MCGGSHSPDVGFGRLLCRPHVARHDPIREGGPPPRRFLARPAAILAYRLRETPLPEPPPAERAVRPAPLQTCDGCDRAFRSYEPGLCGGCREHDEHHPAVA